MEIYYFTFVHNKLAEDHCFSSLCSANEFGLICNKSFELYNNYVV